MRGLAVVQPDSMVAQVCSSCSRLQQLVLRQVLSAASSHLGVAATCAAGIMPEQYRSHCSMSSGCGVLALGRPSDRMLKQLRQRVASTGHTSTLQW